VEGKTTLEVLLPAVRRPGLVAELRSRCAAAGFECEIRRGTSVSRKTQVAVLTRTGTVDEHALARLSSWTYTRLGTRPFDPAPEPEPAPDTTWTATQLKMVVGRIVKGEFVRGVERICDANDVRCEWRVDRRFVALTIAVVITGPAHRVGATADQITRWQARFGNGT
jgi:hypothetical protein